MSKTLLRLVLALVSYDCIGQIGDRLHFYPCSLPIEPTPDVIYSLWPNICLNGFGGISITQQPNEKSYLNDLNHYGKLYVGLNIIPDLSFHYEFEGSFQGDLKSEDPLFWNDRKIESLYLQLGNSYMRQNLLAIGKIDMPFGINDDPFRNQIMGNDDRYWLQSKPGYRITRKNNNGTRYELGIQLDDKIPWKQAFEDSKPISYSFRASVDLAALEGTRIVASGHGSISDNKRYGLALLNQAQGAQTSIEWVRSYTKIPTAYFDQLFRFNYYSRVLHSKRYIFQYENDRLRHWQSMIQLHFIFLDHSSLFVSGGYRRGISGNQLEGWILSTGIEVAI